jgi:hypothetical protein
MVRPERPVRLDRKEIPVQDLRAQPDLRVLKEIPEQVRPEQPDLLEIPVHKVIPG